jgi:Ca2+-transporting ATPase
MASLPANVTLTTTFAELFSMLLPETGLQLLRTHPDEGLAESDAVVRSSLRGPNSIGKAEKESLWGKIAEQLNNPLILLLLASAGVSLLLGHIDDAVSIAIAVLIVSSGEHLDALEMAWH